MTQLHGVVGGDDAPACVGTPGQWWFPPSTPAGVTVIVTERP